MKITLHGFTHSHKRKRSQSKTQVSWRLRNQVLEITRNFLIVDIRKVYNKVDKVKRTVRPKVNLNIILDGEVV